METALWIFCNKAECTSSLENDLFVTVNKLVNDIISMSSNETEYELHCAHFRVTQDSCSDFAQYIYMSKSTDTLIYILFMNNYSWLTAVIEHWTQMVLAFLTLSWAAYLHCWTNRIPFFLWFVGWPPGNSYGINLWDGSHVNSNLPATNKQTFVLDKTVFPLFMFSCQRSDIVIKWQITSIVFSPNVDALTFVRKFALKCNRFLVETYYTVVQCGVPPFFIQVCKTKKAFTNRSRSLDCGHESVIICRKQNSFLLHFVF